MKLEEALKSDRFVSEQQKVNLNILYSAYWLRSNFAAVLKGMDLTLEQNNVLRIVKGMHPEPMCVKDIGVRMIEKSSNVPRIIDRLVEKKLVKRSNSGKDKRETLVSMTEKGINTLMAAKQLLDNVTAGITHLNDEQAKQLNELLEKIRK